MSAQAGVASDENRCPNHHHMSGWCCQLDAGHDGPCLADAFGSEWRIEGKRIMHAWHQPPGEPACAQTACANPKHCQCVIPLSRKKGRDR